MLQRYLPYVPVAVGVSAYGGIFAEFFLLPVLILQAKPSGEQLSVAAPNYKPLLVIPCLNIPV
jgi:hypothetical protein